MKTGVEIYVANMKRLPLVEQYEEILKILPEEARQKAQRYRKEEDRVRSAVGALMIRRSVERTLQQKGLPMDHHIRQGKYGKPFVEEYTDIHFSLSHSGALIVYAQGAQLVGVDVEELRDIDLAEFDGYLRAEEKKRIVSAENSLAEFYRIWTVREAFSKMVGQGLSVFEEEEATFDYDREQGLFRDKRFMIHSFLSGEYIISLCMENIPADTVLRLITEEDWNLEFLCQLI